MEWTKVRLDLSYQGSGFAGWARQPRLRTVQQVIEDGLAIVLRQDVGDVHLTVAGRTDAGVHARGQVAHFDVPVDVLAAVPGQSKRPATEALRTRLTGVLSDDDIVIRRASIAPAAFDARFGALARHYVYRLCDDPTQVDPLRSGYVVTHKRRLDVAEMAVAAAGLVGLHDFAAYCKPRPGATTIRMLQRFDWQRPTDGPDAGLVVASVSADAFCHSMVRTLVGASLAVGEGRRTPAWMAKLLADRQRDAAAHVAPAHGLTLEAVDYPPDDELAARAIVTRARRNAEQSAERAAVHH